MESGRRTGYEVMPFWERPEERAEESEDDPRANVEVWEIGMHLPRRVLQGLSFRQHGAPVREFWYDKVTSEVHYEAPRKDLQDQDVQLGYARLYSKNAFYDELGSCLVGACLRATEFFATAGFCGNLYSDPKYASLPWGFRPMFLAIFWVSTLISVGLAVWLTRKRLERDKQMLGDLIRNTGSATSRARFFVNLLLFDLLMVPKALQDAPVLFHPRKVVQPHRAFASNGHRAWILGWHSKAQFHFENAGGLPITQIPVLVALVVLSIMKLCIVWLVCLGGAGGFDAALGITLCVSLALLWWAGLHVWYISVCRTQTHRSLRRQAWSSDVMDNSTAAVRSIIAFRLLEEHFGELVPQRVQQLVQLWQFPDELEGIHIGFGDLESGIWNQEHWEATARRPPKKVVVPQASRRAGPPAVRVVVPDVAAPPSNSYDKDTAYVGGNGSSASASSSPPKSKDDPVEAMDMAGQSPEQSRRRCPFPSRATRLFCLSPPRPPAREPRRHAQREAEEPSPQRPLLPTTTSFTLRVLYDEVSHAPFSRVPTPKPAVLDEEPVCVRDGGVVEVVLLPRTSGGANVRNGHSPKPKKATGSPGAARQNGICAIEDRPAATTPWTCRRCKFPHNHPGAETCEVCNAPREQLDHELLSAEQAQLQSPSVSQGTWECEKCKFPFNHRTLVACEACSARRPVPGGQQGEVPVAAASAAAASRGQENPGSGGGSPQQQLPDSSSSSEGSDCNLSVVGPEEDVGGPLDDPIGEGWQCQWPGCRAEHPDFLNPLGDVYCNICGRLPDLPG